MTHGSRRGLRSGATPWLRPNVPHVGERDESRYGSAARLNHQTEDLRVKYPGEDFERLDQARAGPVEILIAVGAINTAIPDCAHSLPARPASQKRHFRASPVQVEATRHEDDDFGVAPEQLLPFQPRRMFARLSEQIQSAGEPDQFRHPVSCRHQPLEPLDAGDSWLTRDRARLRRDGFDTSSQTSHQRAPLIGDSESVGDVKDVIPDIRQRVGESERIRGFEPIQWLTANATSVRLTAQ